MRSRFYPKVDFGKAAIVEFCRTAFRHERGTSIPIDRTEQPAIIGLGIYAGLGVQRDIAGITGTMTGIINPTGAFQYWLHVIDETDRSNRIAWSYI